MRQAEATVHSTADAVNYFPVFAKGPAIALALDLAGLDWEGVFLKPGSTMENIGADWGELKPKTPKANSQAIAKARDPGAARSKLTTPAQKMSHYDRPVLAPYRKQVGICEPRD